MKSTPARLLHQDQLLVGAMIHEVNGNFVISSHEVWVPGVYDTQKTARWAFQFPNAVLEKAQEMANERDGVITADDLRAFKEQG